MKQPIGKVLGNQGAEIEVTITEIIPRGTSPNGGGPKSVIARNNEGKIETDPEGARMIINEIVRQGVGTGDRLHIPRRSFSIDELKIITKGRA